MFNKVLELLRKYLPKSLFYRFLLIIAVPVILVQFVSVYVFYNRHWEDVSNRIAQNIAANISLVDAGFNESLANSKKSESYNEIVNKLSGYTNLQFSFKNNIQLTLKEIAKYKKKDDLFFDSLKNFKNHLVVTLQKPVLVKKFEKDIIIQVQQQEGVLEFVIKKKMILTSTTYIFILWSIGIALLMLVVSILFLKNQIKSIQKLTEAASKFEMNKKFSDFKPCGAQEIREAGVAFMEMKERIMRQVEQRTMMLAGISHDLRTPLTRLKLQIEMLKGNKNNLHMKKDIEEMEEMIDKYLEFAKGENTEIFKKVNFKDYTKDLVSDYKRCGYEIELEDKIKDKYKTVKLKELSFKRALNNIIDNGLKYGDLVSVSISSDKDGMRIMIDDNGPGVSEKEIKEISRPFYKTDSSRNLQKGGVGLGLSVAKEIIKVHNGSIEFSKSLFLGGLRVVITI